MQDYMIDSFQSFIDTKSVLLGIDKGFEMAFNFIVNLIYGFTKFMWFLLDSIMTMINNMNLYSDASKKVFEVSSALYHSMYSSFGMYIISGVLIYMLFRLLTKGQRDTSRRLFVLFLVLCVNVLFYSYGSTFLTQSQTVMTNVEKVVVRAVTYPIAKELGYEEETQTPETDAISLEPRAVNKDIDTNELLSKYLFREAVLLPFASMNFGKSQFNEAEMSAYLIRSDVTDVVGRRNEIVGLYEQQAANNPFLSSAKLGDKFIIAIFSVINVFYACGVILLVLFLKVVFQLMVLCLIIVLPIMSILSLLPQFSDSVFNVIRKMVGLLLSSSLVSVAALFIFFILNLISTGIDAVSGDPSGYAIYPIQVIVKTVFIVILVINRNKIFKLLSGSALGRSQVFQNISNVTKAAGERFSRAKEMAHNVRFKLRKNTVSSEDGDKSKRFYELYHGSPSPSAVTQPKTAPTPGGEKFVVPEKQRSSIQDNLNTKKQGVSDELKQKTGNKPTSVENRPKAPLNGFYEQTTAPMKFDRYTPIEELKKHYPNANKYQLINKRPELFAGSKKWQAYFDELEQTRQTAEKQANFKERLNALRQQK